MLQAISPIDGRYASKTLKLQRYFSEYALIEYRILVEIDYFLALCEVLPELKNVAESEKTALKEWSECLEDSDIKRVKEIERTTNHDVKAVEYLIKEKMISLNLADYQEFIHFGLTSQDINNTAIPLSLNEFISLEYLNEMDEALNKLTELANDWQNVPMLARTHGQPASPTRLGKELQVFIERLSKQLDSLANVEITAKFGGATGNFNAHKVAYPAIDWVQFGDTFVEENLQLIRSKFTTQIDHYDSFSEVFHAAARINTILIDLCRDIWTYVQMDYFKQKTKAGEVGSSAMPHKVNPIDFENAEGNLGIANALFAHLAAKLPISRLQRDLTDSTVLRNIGVPFAHTTIATQSILKGLEKLVLNEQKLHEDLEANWMVVAEGIQTILRREAYPQPYEALKELTRGKAMVTKNDIHTFIDGLKVNENVKIELKNITPHNYTGV